MQLEPRPDKDERSETGTESTEDDYCRFSDPTEYPETAVYEDEIDFDIICEPALGLRSRLKKVETLTESRHVSWAGYVEDNENKITKIGQMARRQRAIIRLTKLRQIQEAFGSASAYGSLFEQSEFAVMRQIYDADAVIDEDFPFKGYRRLMYLFESTPLEWKSRNLRQLDLDLERLSEIDPDFEEYAGKLAYLLYYCPKVNIDLDLLSPFPDPELSLLTSCTRMPSEEETPLEDEEDTFDDQALDEDDREFEPEDQSPPQHTPIFDDFRDTPDTDAVERLMVESDEVIDGEYRRRRCLPDSVEWRTHTRQAASCCEADDEDSVIALLLRLKQQNPDHLLLQNLIDRLLPSLHTYAG